MDTAERIQELEGLIRFHSDLYFNSASDSVKTQIEVEKRKESAITDAEFDAMVEELKGLNPESTVLQEVGFVPSYGKKISHTRKMGSLEKTKIVDEATEWARSHSHGKKDEEILIGIMPKMDGIACRLDYSVGNLVLAATRGNGDVGMDITDNVREIEEIPNFIPGFTGEARGEVFMRKKVFNEINERLLRNGEKPFANPRNAANGSLTCQDPKVTASRNLSFRLYDVFSDEEFSTETDKFDWCKSNLTGLKAVSFRVAPLTELASVIEGAEEKRPGLDFEIDGLVFALVSIADQEEAGWNGRCPRGKLAFKFKPEQQKAPCHAIDPQVGRTGRLTPVCRIKPTLISGSTVSNLTLHNYARVKELGINVGDEILIEKAGDVIPQVVRVLTHTGSVGSCHPMPEACPSCGGDVRFDDVNLWCDNPACAAKLEARIEHWLKTLEVLGIGPAIVNSLCSNGLVKDVSDLYFLTEKQVSSVISGDSAPGKVISAIASKKDIPLWQFLCALGIPNVGRTMSKALAKEYKTLNEIREIGKITEGFEHMTHRARLIGLDGVGVVLSRAIIDGMSNLDNTICNLLESVNVIDVQEVTGPLVGKSFCMTGSLPSGAKRNDVVKMIEAAGGEYKSSVGKGLGYLIIADPASTSSKAVKARSLGVECIGEEKLKEMMK